MLSYGFDQVESRSFARTAMQADPNCAMCAWLLAYANGLFLNHPVVTNRSQFVEAQSAAEHAFTLLQKNSKNYSLKELKLIGAMKGRYISFTNQTVGYIRYRDLLAGG